MWIPKKSKRYFLKTAHKLIHHKSNSEWTFLLLPIMAFVLCTQKVIKGRNSKLWSVQKLELQAVMTGTPCHSSPVACQVNASLTCSSTAMMLQKRHSCHLEYTVSSFSLSRVPKKSVAVFNAEPQNGIKKRFIFHVDYNYLIKIKTCS